MMPIGPLMIEHRLIERMVELMKRELRRIKEKDEVDTAFIDDAIDFIRTYADLCHHGKEEGILFRDLAKKQLSPEYKKTMDELIQEHVLARKMVGRLVSAKESFARGESTALKDIEDRLQQLSDFYPAHIEKEDKHFFIPCMGYFTEQEQDNMLQEFCDFDKNVIHEKYKRVVEHLEKV